jgi:hypothetical protein
MIDKEKIPELTYKELIELFGIQEAEKIIIDNQYNFRAVSQIIIGEMVVRYFGLGNFRKWLKKSTGLSMKALLIIFVVIGLILFIFLPF